MRLARKLGVERVAEVLRGVEPDLGIHARRLHAVLRRGAGEERVVETLRGLLALPEEEYVVVARDLLRIGVPPTGGFRRRKAGPDVCTICEAHAPFCWACLCGFKICQACLEENRWGMTCNNVTWECPDCGAMRSF